MSAHSILNTHEDDTDTTTSPQKKRKYLLPLDPNKTPKKKPNDLRTPRAEVAYHASKRLTKLKNKHFSTLTFE